MSRTRSFISFVTLFLVSIFLSPAKAKHAFLVVGHRGAPGYVPEHSTASVAIAHTFGVDFVEPDVVVSKDGVLLVLHDVMLEETTNVAERFPKRKRRDGHYYAVDFNWSELQLLELRARAPYLARDTVARNAAQKEQPEWRFTQELKVSAFRILSFEDYLNLVEGLNRSTHRMVKIIPELKEPEFHSKHGKDIVSLFFKVLRQHPYWSDDNVVIQCFDPRTLKRIRTDKLFNGKLMQLVEGENNGSGIDYMKMLTAEGLSEIATYAEYIGPSLKSLFAVDARGNFKPSDVLKLIEKTSLKAIPYTHRTDQMPVFLEEESLFRAMKKSSAIVGVFTDFADRVIKAFR
jgi:glycerophosphoryl diester phosphodiesterase